MFIRTRTSIVTFAGGTLLVINEQPGSGWMVVHSADGSTNITAMELFTSRDGADKFLEEVWEAFCSGVEYLDFTHRPDDREIAAIDPTAAQVIQKGFDN